MPTLSPGRPPNQFDLLQLLNGAPGFLGALVSTGAAVNNATTATPFNTPQLGPANAAPNTTPPANFANTLAGKTLLLQTTAAGLILPSGNPNMLVNGVPGQLIIAQQTVLPPATGTAPGVALLSAERVILTMMPNEGWLQWLPVSGSGNLLIWELR